MCYWILPASGVPIARTAIQALTEDEVATVEVQQTVKAYDESIQAKIGDSAFEDDLPVPSQCKMHPEAEEEDDGGATFKPFAPSYAMPEADEFDVETYDACLQAEVLLPQGDHLVAGTVVGRKRDHDGNPLGKRNPNPILDTRIYEVQFPDGHVLDYAANVIAESIFLQVDDEGNQFLLLQEIIDHKKDDSAVKMKDMWIISTNGNKSICLTTKGWKLCAVWRDGSTSWEPLKDLKELNHLQVAEYAVANDIDVEPAFTWWVKDALKCHNRIISAARSRYWKKTPNLELESPRQSKKLCTLIKRQVPISGTWPLRKR